MADQGIPKRNTATVAFSQGTSLCQCTVLQAGRYTRLYTLQKAEVLNVLQSSTQEDQASPHEE